MSRNQTTSFSTPPRRPGITRREAVGGAAAVSLATLLGCGSQTHQTAGDESADAIIVGAGMAGLAAAAQLRRQGLSVTVLEARDRVGGRVHTVSAPGAPIDLGGAWIHDQEGNPLTEIAKRAGARTLTTDYESVELRNSHGQRVPDQTVDTSAARQDEVFRSLSDLASTEAADSSLSFSDAYARALSEAGQLTGEASQTLEWLTGVALPLDTATDASEISLIGWDEGDGYKEGGDGLVVKGASQLIQAVGKGVPVRKGVQVSSIRQDKQGVVVTARSGESFRGRCCVVTVPLGVLRSGSITFTPPLPSRHRRAIAALRMGTLDKVILRYPNQWWPEATQLGVIGSSIDNTVSTFNMEPATGLPLLVAFTGGSHARALERLKDDELVNLITDELASGFGESARHHDWSLVTRWSQDEWSQGSYSYMPPGASADDRAAFGQPAGRILFAGEHTSVARPSTMDGALRSGLTAAARSAGLLGRG